MRYGQIRNYDIANGPGIRTSIFVTGCTHHCKGCFNELYMDFDYGNLWTDVQTGLLVKCMEDTNISGLTVLGGEPMQNIDGLMEVLPKVREAIDSLAEKQAAKSALPNATKKPARKKTIWLYSGYTFEEILLDENKVKLLSFCDVLVDGRFVEELRNIRLKFRGSENQRILDVPASLKERRPVLLPGYELPPRYSVMEINKHKNARSIAIHSTVSR